MRKGDATRSTWVCQAQHAHLANLYNLRQFNSCASNCEIEVGTHGGCRERMTCHYLSDLKCKPKYACGADTASSPCKPVASIGELPPLPPASNPASSGKASMACCKYSANQPGSFCPDVSAMSSLAELAPLPAAGWPAHQSTFRKHDMKGEMLRGPRRQRNMRH